MRMMMIKLRAYNLQSIVIEVQEHNRWIATVTKWANELNVDGELGTP